MRRFMSALCPTTALPMAAPSTQSLFARSWRYLDQGDVNRLLRGHYSPGHFSYRLMRRYHSLSSPSALASFEESLQVATSPCCWRDLPSRGDPVSCRLSLAVSAVSSVVPV